MMSIADDCLMKMAKHPAASRVLDALLGSKRISAEDKMQFAQKLNVSKSLGFAREPVCLVAGTHRRQVRKPSV